MIFQSNADAKFARYLQRVLILDAQPAPTRLLVELLTELGARNVVPERNARSALTAARDTNPQIIFTEYAGPAWDGLQFVRDLRRSDLACRMAPVVMVSAEATAQAILGARDAGVHEYLRKPYNMKDLVRRIEAVTLKPREWVEAVSYIGPDRRRFNSGEYAGPRKRKSDVREDSNAAKVAQALRILKSALEAADRDPQQALRSMKTQASDLIKLGVQSADSKLATAAAGLQRALREVEAVGLMDSAKLKAAARPLLSYLPTDSQGQAA